MKQELSQKTVHIIKESAELITANDTEITARMYEILFSKYPHLKELFIDAPQGQLFKLAEALSAFAINIDKLHVLTPALEVIAKKHVELKIKPQQYPIVGLTLTEAILDVLPNRASSEFLEAWREAYDYIACVLIDMEEKLYEEVV